MESCDPNYSAMARGLGCGTAGDLSHSGAGPFHKTLGLSYERRGEKPCPAHEARIEKARKDRQPDLYRIAALAGEVECWIQIAGVWFTAFIQQVTDAIATIQVSGELQTVFIGDLVFEKPVRWPV